MTRRSGGGVTNGPFRGRSSITAQVSLAFASFKQDAIIDSVMAQLIVRQLDEELVQALKRRAARVGRSAEAEHREILREALRGEFVRWSFKQFLREMPAVGNEADFNVLRELPREPVW